MTEPTITDITAQFDDINEHDVVYRSEKSYVIKIRTRRLISTDLVFAITGALCHEDTGKAKLMEDGQTYFIGREHQCVIAPETETADVAATLEAERHCVVRQIERAEANRFAAAALAGVIPATEPM